jgi:hypothetical protein
MAFGVWRAWHAWRVREDATSWVRRAGIPGSMSAGGVVLGYYFVYSAGVLRRTLRHRRMG